MTYALIALTIILLYNYSQISRFKINRIKLESSKLSKDLKITQISDFHSSKMIDIDRVVESVDSFDPDIVVLTGDMIDGSKHDIDRTLSFIDKLLSLNIDIYFVVGNHEYRNENNGIFISSLRDRGLIILENRDVELKEYNLRLGGVNFGVSEENYNKVVEDMDSKTYNILLSHSPKYPINYSKSREDLILCGHTHGGQVRIPFVGALLSPSEGLFPDYDKGMFQIGKSLLYIDSGLGTSALPIRMFNRAQISNIVIETNKK